MKIELDERERDATLAGLRLLQSALESRAVQPNDGDVGEILTNSGKHEGLDLDEMDELCERLNT